MPSLSQRAQQVAPFQVMRLLTQAQALQAAGRDIIHMEVGEPDFATPEPIVAAAQAALSASRQSYTPACGLPELRQAVAGHYQQVFSLAIEPERVVITAGASAALQLAFAACLEPGEAVMLTDPGYPCNEHTAAILGCQVNRLRLNAEQAYRPSAAAIAAQWTPQTKALCLASPANPTGVTLNQQELAAIATVVAEQDATLIVDELYQGLHYAEQAPHTAAALGEQHYIINSFSKYFCMTGWRLGWLLAPSSAVPAIERMAQNLFLAPSTLAQQAALAAFSPASLAICEQRREQFKQRRDYLLTALAELGLSAHCKPEGAFYVYVDVSAYTSNSLAFCEALLHSVGLAVTPGSDFSEETEGSSIRLAYTIDIEQLAEAIRRLQQFLQKNIS